jgi:hypothetical protein
VPNGINGVRAQFEKLGSQQHNVFLYVAGLHNAFNRLAIPVLFAGDFPNALPGNESRSYPC